MIWLLIHDIRTRIQNAVMWIRWLPTYFFCPYINVEHEWSRNRPLRLCDLNLYEEEFMRHKVIRKGICNYRNCPRMRGEE